MSERRGGEGRSIFDRLSGKEGDKAKEGSSRQKGSDKNEARQDEENAGPIKSVEGWIVYVRGLNEETTDSDLIESFAEFGQVLNHQMPLARLTGYVKGYALVEYGKKEQAERAIREMNGKKLCEKQVSVGWAFSKEN